MKRRAFLGWAGLVAGLPHLATGAAPTRNYSDENFRLALPEGYLGPVEHVQATSVTRGFRKPYAGTPLNTVIMVTVHDFGPSFAKRVPAERAKLTRETLEGVVENIESNRTGFKKGEPRPVVISGYQGLRVDWIGGAQGVPFAGVVYCVLAGSHAYAVQIQDPSGRGAERLKEAMQAVERMRVLR